MKLTGSIPILIGALSLLFSPVASKFHGGWRSREYFVPIRKTPDPPPGVVFLEVEKNRPTYDNPDNRTLGRRSEGKKTWEEQITNQHIGYFTRIRIGSPPQEIQLHLDTGSADLWIPAPAACKALSANKQVICSKNSFDINKSSSANITGKDKFQIRYYDGNKALGDYFTDNVEIAGVTVYDQEMGLGTTASVPYGIAGIGYHHLVSQNRPEGETYNNLPIRMYKQGLINTVAYSLWMSDLHAEKGSLLFGGIDVSKFRGPLKRVPVLFSDKGIYDYFTVPLHGLRSVSPSSSTQIEFEKGPLPVILDTGATLTYLPNDVATKLWREVGAIWLRELGAPMIPCEAKNSGGVVKFQFGDRDGPVISVPMEELVLRPALMPEGQPIVGTAADFQGVELCQFGVRNSSGPSILGDTFQRSAFVVHDLINHEAGLAQASLGEAGEPEIIAFPEYGARIPEMERPW